MQGKIKYFIADNISKQFSLPCSTRKIDGVNISTERDDAFKCVSDDALARIIYHSIVGYSFNEYDLTQADYNNLFEQALITKIKYKKSEDEKEKIKYGFYGEVVLDALLKYSYSTTPIIARGYFYNPTSKSEVTGYDSYHLIEIDNKVFLWFGEVKFRSNLSNCTDAITDLNDKISDDYLNSNIFAMVNRKDNLNISNSIINSILDAWTKNPSIKPIDELQKYNVTLVCPLLFIHSSYSPTSNNYEERIKKGIDYLNNKFKTQQFHLSIDYQIFCIFLPVEDTKKIKKDVIEWIDTKQVPML